ncbi:MAG: APC family permease [Anaerolineales bacterium]|nr:APC family permease [Anaerolineales bacterium]
MNTVTVETPEAAPRRSWQQWLIGKPLATAEAEHQTISKKVGLAIFSSDAISSSAYATDEILIVLGLAGAVALSYSIPIAIAIALLLAIVTISYEQTIHAYPNGGGAYIVSRDNLGENAAQIAGAALLTDYILTVAVSISSGVAQITSAFPALYEWRVVIALALVAFMTVVNLRGVKESGNAFAIPTYFFLGITFLTIGLGFFRYFTGTLGTVTGVEPMHTEVVQALSAFLVLRAFSSGAVALTGVEAISNGVTAFKEPRSRNAGITLILMSTILSALFFSVTFLAQATHAVPSHVETIFSQIGRTIYGVENPLYLVLLGGTTLILIMAANTAYNGFPLLAAMIASDGFLPRQLTFRGSRLVFTYGIVGLAGVASLLIVIFRAETTALIPLYAIGVFLSFTLSQAGMAIRWWRSRRLQPGETVKQLSSTLHHDPRWRLKMVINGFGALCTLVVMLIFAVTKFTSGAWIVVIIIPVLVAMFFGIHSHYRRVAARLSLDSFGMPTRIRRHRVLVPVSSVHRGALHALHYARALSPDVTAVHIALDPEAEAKVRAKWEQWGDGVRLVIVPSPYRALLEPMLGYIRQVAKQRQPGEVLTVVVPQFVPERPWHNLLHMQTAVILQIGLLGLRNIVITEVPYHIEGD